jgi:DNA-binding MarR family transcriptional regulator
MMTKVFEEMAALDRLIHEPARLSILTALSACNSADFIFLQRLTGLTVGNLSGHLSKLEEAGLLHTEKQFVARRPNTLAELTKKGRAAIENHWNHLEALRKDARAWKLDR